MTLSLTLEDNRYEQYSIVTIDDSLDYKGCAYTIVNGIETSINKDQAATLVNHLIKVFDLKPSVAVEYE